MFLFALQIKFILTRIFPEVFQASTPDRKQLLSLDSLYKSRSSSLQVIGVPVSNSDATIQKSALIKLLRDTLGISFIVSDIGKAKKSFNNNQHALLNWITHVSSNKHFDKDIADDGQMFLITRTGILYATLGRLTILDGIAMEEVLDNEPISN